MLLVKPRFGLFFPQVLTKSLLMLIAYDMFIHIIWLLPLI